MVICPTCLTTHPDEVRVCPHDGAALVPEAALPRDPELEVGAKVGEYVIEAKIGAGTFGVVYRGIQPLIGKQVAVKVLSRKYSADPLVVSRFIAEARAVNQIRHKNIIDIFSFGQLPDGRHYHVMELLEGEPLGDYLTRHGGHLPVASVVPILRGLGRALDAAHAAGIAHRDLKPDNVFLARDEEGTPFPKLLDFGIAKLLTDDVPRQHTTATGAAVGTPHYMSPEQCQGPDVDHRTDIYAFGVLTYQLVSGHLPFVGSNVVEVLMKQMTEEARPPSTVSPHVPPELDAPILLMMAKDPDARPDSLQVAVQQLADAAQQAGLPVPVPVQSGEIDPSMVRSGPRPAPIAAPVASSPAVAATVLSGEVPTPARTSGGRSGPIWLGVAVMVVAVAAVPFLLDGRAPAPEAPPPRGPPAPPPARPPPTVRLTLAGAPADARVVGPDGAAWDPTTRTLEVPRSGEGVEVRVAVEGFEEWTRTVVPTESATLTVTLARLAPPPRPRPPPPPPRPPPPPPPDKPGKDDLEVPSWGE